MLSGSSIRWSTEIKKYRQTWLNLTIKSTCEEIHFSRSKKWSLFFISFIDISKKVSKFCSIF